MPVEPGRVAARVAGVLLAAGTSSRMGVNKLLLDHAGESLLRATARRALAAGLEPLVVVLGHEAKKTEREIAGLGCRAVRNPIYREGIASSLEAGISALDTEISAAVVLLADMPRVTSEMIAALVRHYREGGTSLVVSDYEGTLAPPILYDRSLFPELKNLKRGDRGQIVARRHRDAAAVVRWPVAALEDLDLPADLVSWTQRRGAGG